MKKRNIGYIILFSVIAIACLWAFISAGIITSGFQKKLEENSLGKQELTIQNMLITETKEGNKFWEIFAESGYYDNKDQVAVLNDIVGNFYQDNQVVASFESARGTYSETRKEIILYEKTLIVYKDGSNVSANQMSWAGSNADIIAQGNVRLELPSKVVVYADKATLSSDFKTLKVIGRTKTEIYDKGNLEI
ncbi:MAG: LPS export ABC transporter periplasmic protein LptC [Candidatus Gastranaerophilales bacterium]|nr:LPS export ABC transporter periplasmic protein LptC [Candidatus Gastranaerophilales bacterium]